MSTHSTQHSTALRPDGRPVIAVSIGDPLGIGPEIVVKALDEPSRRGGGGASYRIHGSLAAIEAAERETGRGRAWRSGGGVEIIDDGSWSGADLGSARRATASGGAASFRWVEGAIEDVRAGRADAIATAPISKTSWMLAGHTEFPGHTELLAARFGAARSGMLFVGPHLRVMLATIHVPLMRVGAALSSARVLESIELAQEACVRLGVRSPRIAVCGLNPHAGEGGILGSEDERAIAPAVESARAKGIGATGPLPGDTVFKAACAPPLGKGDFDCVVAMYHDQGLIPVKLVDGERAVNVTVGLPVIRTSPAHGTAFDIAGTNAASAVSMGESIDLAIRMTMV